MDTRVGSEYMFKKLDDAPTLNLLSPHLRCEQHKKNMAVNARMSQLQCIYRWWQNN